MSRAEKIIVDARADAAGSNRDRVELLEAAIVNLCYESADKDKEIAELKAANAHFEYAAKRAGLWTTTTHEK